MERPDAAAWISIQTRREISGGGGKVTESPATKPVLLAKYRCQKMTHPILLIILFIYYFLINVYFYTVLA